MLPPGPQSAGRPSARRRRAGAAGTIDEEIQAWPGTRAGILMRATVVILLLVVLTTGVVDAQITGTVVDSTSGDPIADARVRIQATTTPPAISDASGAFSLNAPGAVDAVVTAVLPYDSALPINYVTGFAEASDGDAVVIALDRLPAGDIMPYEPSTSIDCATCHFDQYQQWTGS